MTDNAKNNAKGTAAPAESLVGRIKQNPKMKWLTLGIAAAVVAVAGYMLYGKFVKGPAEEKAQIQLNEGMQLMQQGISQYQMVAQLDATPDSVLLPTLKTQGVINDSVPADSIPVLIKQYRDTLCVMEGAERKGEQRTRAEISKKLFERGMAIEEIALITSLTEEEVRAALAES